MDPIWIGAEKVATGFRAWVLDWQTKRIVELGTDSVGGKARVLRTVSLETTRKPFANAAGALDLPTWALVRGKRVFLGGMLLDKSFEEWDDEGEYVRASAEPPPLSPRRISFPLARQALSITLGAASPIDGRFAVFHQYSPRVFFMDSSGTRYATPEGPRPLNIIVGAPSPAELGKAGEHGAHHVRITSVDSSEIGYTAVSSTARYVYAAFCGCRRGASPEPRFLHVFDWEGRFVREVVLDRFIGPFVVIGDTLLVGTVGTARSNARDLSLARWRLESQ